jgi:hypothetical protein
VTTPVSGKLERDWAQIGVLFGCAPSGRTPDLERTLLATARQCPDNFRLFTLSVSWLSQYSHFVAHHRLKRLVRDELEADSRAVFGLIIEEAVALGATRDLLIATEACSPRTDPIPLALVQRDSPTLGALALQHASERSKRWGVWAPAVTPKDSAIRPVRWILAKNPEYRDRIIRKGDLRVSILETLRRDVPRGIAPSESALTRLAGATRTAVRKALHALELEGEITVGAAPGNDRDHAVRLVTAA